MSEQVKRRATVLIVEDDGELRSAWRRRLRGLGYRVVTAEDDEEATERAECDRCGGPDLILTDPQLPTLDALIRRARTHPRLRGVPLVTIDPERPGGGEGIRSLESTDELERVLERLPGR